MISEARCPSAGMVDTVNAALNQILTRPDSAGFLTARGIDVQPGSPDQLGRLVERELTKWRRFVDEVPGLSAD